MPDGVFASTGDHRRLLSELFHALNQPLTSLRCSLELSLDERLGEPPREGLQDALRHAEQVARLTAGIRSLIEADDGADGVLVEFEDYIHNAVLELLPLAETAEVGILLRGSGAGRVRMEPQRLREALFYLLEYVIRSLPARSAVSMETGPSGNEALLLITAHRGRSHELAGERRDQRSCGDNEVNNDKKDAPDETTRTTRLANRLGLAISSRIFESAGGKVFLDEGNEMLRLEVSLPVATPDGSDTLAVEDAHPGSRRG